MAKRRRKKLAEELLVLKRLGPIEELRLEPRDLTLIIGEQATGKSLVAQMLYFFRGLRRHLQEKFRPAVKKHDNWPDVLLKEVLDDMRGVAFGYFANGTAKIEYQQRMDGYDWSVSVYGGNRRVNAGEKLRRQIEQWAEPWDEQLEKRVDFVKIVIFGPEEEREQIFIPTERSMFTRYIENQPSVLFSDFQPLPFQNFTNTLQRCKRIYARLRKRRWLIKRKSEEALRGRAYVPRSGPREWKWKTVVNGGREKILPIEALASGQMEAWPFFVVAEVVMRGKEKVDLYFEEPETHLHPRAQVAVMDTIVALVNHGHRVVVTTHSPYLLYRLNNMLQRHRLRPEERSGDLTLDPAKLCAIRLDTRGKSKSILDRRTTGLVDAGELEKVADELGGEFDRLLERSEPER